MYVFPCVSRVLVISDSEWLFIYWVSVYEKSKQQQQHQNGEWEIKMEAKSASIPYAPLLLCSCVSQFDVTFYLYQICSSFIFKKRKKGEKKPFLDVVFKGKEILQKFKVIFHIEWFRSPCGKRFLQRGHFKQVNEKDTLSIKFQNGLVFDL